MKKQKGRKHGWRVGGGGGGGGVTENMPNELKHALLSRFSGKP
mgnify:CR=1 FL=1